MTDETFEKAPLLEIIAELRWPAPVTLIPGGGTDQAPAQIVLSSSAQDELFERLGSELFRTGFGKSERLVPIGIPALPNQPVIRYRSEKEKSVLYQTGPGMFSVHGTPPYRSWKEFTPFVVNGAEAILRARSDTNNKSPFSSVTLRYLDLFDADLTEGRDIEHFVSEVMGISVKLPDALMRIRSTNEIRSMLLRLVFPLSFGVVNLSIADGSANNRTGPLLDIAVASSQAVEERLDAIMSFFTAAHEVTHTAFLELTKPIHHLMHRVEGGVV